MDLAFLRHDKPLHPGRIQGHLKHVPQYLLPKVSGVATSTGAADGPGSYTSRVALGLGDRQRKRKATKFSKGRQGPKVDWAAIWWSQAHS